MIIDTHAHIYGEEYDEDFEAMLRRSLDAGVEHIIMPGVAIEDYDRTIRVLEAHPDMLSAAIGLHPAYVKEDYRAQLAHVHAHATTHPWVAIGEIGLDYYWSTDFKTEQIEAFEDQLRLSLQLDLPVILHIREAFADTIAVLRQPEFAHVRGVAHSFTGTQEDLDEVLSLPNLMIAINGVATFKNCNLRDYIGRIPLDRLLVETDAPYLSPAPLRGKRNEPAYLIHTIGHLAPIYGLSTTELAEITTRNARRLFTLP